MQVHYSTKYTYLDVLEVSDVTRIIDSFGFQKIGLVLDSGVNNLFLDSLVVDFKDQLSIAMEYHNESREPFTTDVDQLVECILTNKVDSLVAIGGGSTLDLAKAASVVAKLGNPAISFQGCEFKAKEKLFLFAIPTNAGSGAEATKSAVLFNSETGVKRGINNSMILPDSVILATPLLKGIPDRVFISAIFDGFTHALESYIGQSATDTIRQLSSKAISIYLSQFLDILESKEVKINSEILKASFYAGSAICNSETGPVHALAYPLSEYLGYSHGEAIATVLLPVVELYYEKNLDELSFLLEFGTVRSINELLNILIRIRDDYLPQDTNSKPNLMQFAERSLELKGAVQNSPFVWTFEDSMEVYKRICQSP